MGPAGSRMSMLRLVLKGAKILIAKGREALSDQLSVSGVFGGPEAMYQLEDPAHSAGSQCKPSRPQQLGLFFFAGMDISGINAQLFVLHVGHGQASVLCCLQVTLMVLLCVGWPGMNVPPRFSLSVICCFRIEPYQLLKADLPFPSFSGGVVMSVCLPSYN